MNVEYLPSFIKDLKVLKSSSSYKRIKSLVFKEIPTCQNLEDICNIKKMKVAEDAYQIRVGDYRIGFFFKNEIIIFARVCHRKDIYKIFP